MTLRTDYSDGGATPSTTTVTASDMNAISGQVNTNTSDITKRGMLAPVQGHTAGDETYTISGGTVTQITGLTINSGSYTPAVNDRILIATAPASTGAGTLFTSTFNPANGVYVVTSLAGGNIAVSRATDMSGSISPAGLTVYSEFYGSTWQPRAVWTVTNPYDASAFSYGSGSIEIKTTGGRSLFPDSVYIGNGKIGFFNTTPGVSSYVQVNSATPGGGDQTLTLPAPTTDTLVSRTSTDDVTNKRATLAAGSSSVAPLKLTSGTNLTTAAAGAVEYDGTVFYLTPAASTRHVNDAEQFITLTSARSLTANTTAQAIFNAPSNGTVTLVGSTTYFFECVFSVTGLSTSSHTLSFGFGGTATITRQLWQAYTTATAGTFTTPAAPVWSQQTATAAIIAAQTTNNAVMAQIKGKLVIGTGGTLIPQITQNTNSAAGSVTNDSFFRIWTVGANTVQSVGNWS